MRPTPVAAALALTALTPITACTNTMNTTADPPTRASSQDRARAGTFQQREDDWRVGPVVYQVIVDRYAPPENPDAKRHLYPDPKRLKPWHENPEPGVYVEAAGVWSHELEFWGGDLQSLTSNLDHIKQLGADVLYLNPVKSALTNHKYDASDYTKISPEYGDRQQLKQLAATLHDNNMKLMLDGVFNHTGRNADEFQDALQNPDSPHRDRYFIDDRYPRGYRSWYNTKNLPELNLENPEVRDFLWNDPDSIVRSFLDDGADGWRLDVAYDLGFNHLASLTAAAHDAKPGSWIVGEIWSYPEQWSPALDGVMNFHARALIFDTVNNNISPATAADMLQTMIDDYGTNNALRSWIVLDNHDTPRLNHMLPDQQTRRLAQVLQFTIPGAPVIYYGTEIGMTGGGDPENRAPMRWAWLDGAHQKDAENADNNPADRQTAPPDAEQPAPSPPTMRTDTTHPRRVRAEEELAWARSLVAMRSDHPALRLGDFRRLHADNLLAFMRWTDRRDQTVVVAANPGPKPVTERVQLRDSKQMGYTPFRDIFTGAEFPAHSGMLTLTVPARTALVLAPTAPPPDRYSPYKRMQ